MKIAKISFFCDILRATSSFFRAGDCASNCGNVLDEDSFILLFRCCTTSLRGKRKSEEVDFNLFFFILSSVVIYLESHFFPGLFFVNLFFQCPLTVMLNLQLFLFLFPLSRIIFFSLISLYGMIGVA